MVNSKQDKEGLREAIILEMRKIAKECGLDRVSKSQFEKHSRIKIDQLDKVFRTWNEAVTAAGFQPDVRARIPDDELLEEFFRVSKELRKIPTVVEFGQISKFSPDTYRKGRHWGNWANVLIAFRKWLETNHPDSEFLSVFKEKPEISQPIKAGEQKLGDGFVWVSRKGVVYGPPLDFRGLRHEPINEQGVVFLFGKISDDLGFIIEAIRTEYPDCDGKRLVDRNKKLWEPVSIEFEYRSRNFVEHGHDPDKCDVIVCWIHDWPDCPLEVIELKSVIARLR